jgi:hypothetical protein
MAAYLSSREEHKPRRHIMNRILAGFAAAFALAAPLSAAADTIELSAPLMSASLHEGDVDMNVFYISRGGDGFDVIATYAPVEASADAARLIMKLADGDAVRFALPGHEDTTYSFRRAGATVAIRAEPAAASAAWPES